MEYLWMLLGSIVLAVVIAWTIDTLRRRQAADQVRATDEAQQKILQEANREAEAIRREAELRGREAAVRAKNEAEEELKQMRRDLLALEKGLADREQALQRKDDAIEKRDAESKRREQALKQQEEQLEKKSGDYDRLIDETRQQLERTASLTRDEARQQLVQSMVDEAKHEAAKRIRVIEQEAKEDADRQAKKVISIAIERLAGEFVAERTVSVVHLPSDDMKGRIIGREGRNIRALEAATGVDLIIDDTPEAVVISCHNPIRREIAKRALERLLVDGRIHPGRIEEVVRKAEDAVEESIKEAGQKAVFEVGIHGVHPEIVKLIGMLQFRYSYAQNVLTHSMECAFICGAMAAELGLNVKQARRAGLLHDIGKALTHEVDGSHAIIGADIARKYGESAKVVNAIAAHHEEVKAETILAPLVDAADALSGARPGARREMLESYVRRLEDLERISLSFSGVQKCFAVQAGREIRIVVQPEAINDDRAAMLAHEVARKIEGEMTYPGQIKVTVIREMRASEYAR